jgi:hypothetical protein
MADMKDTLRDAGHKVAQAAERAKDWVEDKTGLGCGAAKAAADIKPHMSVVSSCGCTVGKVDHVEGGAIKLTRNDSPDGQHHFVPTAWVDHVDNHVHLTKNADETKRDWKADAVSCGGGA